MIKPRNPFGVNPQGNCPVQAEGHLSGGEYYYFRSRGRQWGLDICATEADWNAKKYLFTDGERNAFIWPHGGWISRSKAIALATKAIRKYYDGVRNEVT